MATKNFKIMYDSSHIIFLLDSAGLMLSLIFAVVQAIGKRKDLPRIGPLAQK